MNLMKTTFLTDEELALISNRAQAAQPGPWKSFVEGRDHSSGSNFIMIGDGKIRGEDIELLGATISDQDFMAAARQDVPKLIDEIQKLRKLLDLNRKGKSE